MLLGAVAMERDKDVTDDAQASTRQWADRQMPTQTTTGCGDDGGGGGGGG